MLFLTSIHPSVCNEYTAHVYEMFNAWIGGMKLRFRIIGTAFYGGGLYFVRLPPNFTEAQIRTMSLSGLTAFPYVDLDPKNLVPVQFDAPDWRQIHFHSGQLDLSNSQTFGGWIAVFVNTQLVTQDASVTKIDVRVERAGDFIFKQPCPIFSGPVQATGPIAQGNLYFPNQIGCDDCGAERGATNPVIIRNDRSVDKRWVNGVTFLKSAGGDYTYPLTMFGNLTNFPMGFRDMVSSARLVYSSPNSASLNFNSAPHLTGRTLPVAALQADIQPTDDWLPFNIRVGSVNGWIIQQGHLSTDVARITSLRWLPVTAPAVLPTYVAYSSGFDVAVTPTQFLALSFATYPTALIDLNAPDPIMDAPTPDPYVLAGESFVCWATNLEGSLNATTAPINRDVAGFTGWPLGMSALYSVRNVQETPIAYLRLRSNGHWYTNGTTTTTRVGGTHLRFEEWIDDGQTLPIPTFLQNAMLNQLHKNMAVKMDKHIQKRVMQLQLEMVQENV
jgi:hypothetical protein